MAVINLHRKEGSKRRDQRCETGVHYPANKDQNVVE
jgi:hypothetical protein